QPVFRGGELWHARLAAVAAYEKADAQYRGTVLQAFQNVADALHALRFDADALRAQAHAASVAGDSLNVTQVQFRAGSITYLSLRAAGRNFWRPRLGLVRGRPNRLADTVALYLALGGGWWNRAEIPASRQQQS